MQKIKATLQDLHSAALNLSDGDVADLDAMQSGRDPVEVLEKALNETTYSIKVADQVLAVGGHSAGGIWFVTTNIVSELSLGQRFRFYRLLKEHLSIIKRECPGVHFTNWVSMANRAHIRLLESLKANFQRGYSLSPAGQPFKQFWL